jgi:hypothetical protein
MQTKLITLLLLLSCGLNAQTFIDIPWRPGVVTIAGIEQQGIIRLGGDLSAPWLNNTKVYFVPQKDVVEGKDPKNKLIVEYKPEDIQGYSTYTEDKEGNRVDMNFVTGEILLVKGLSKKNTKVFLLLNEKGAVNIFSFTPEPDSNTSTDYQYALNHSTTYFKKGDGELISAVECDMSSLLKECEEVVTKIKSGAYGFVDLNERTKKKGMGKIMADNAGDNKMEMQISKAVTDYNKCVK